MIKLDDTPNQEKTELMLKPCPFCGGEARLFASDGVMVLCTDCGAQSKCLSDVLCSTGVKGNSVKAVIEAWNRRVDNG